MLISLGYSCQTRFIIDFLAPGLKRMPFDFNITSRPALINALATDGASLIHSQDRIKTFIMPSQNREGIEVSGMYFWHDYPLQDDKLSLNSGWADKMPEVNSKYKALWSRFSDLLRSAEPKTLVLSNSQHNLPEFAVDNADFDRKFGLGRSAFHELVAALDAYGAQNYRLKFLSRSLRELEDIADLEDDRLDYRFVGVLSLRADEEIAASLFSSTVNRDVHDIEGVYDNSEKRVKAISSKLALVFRSSDGQPSLWGSLVSADGGFMAAFEGRRNQVFSAADNGNAIVFSNGAKWIRTDAIRRVQPKDADAL